MNETRLDELLVFLTDKWANNSDFTIELYLDICDKVKELKKKEKSDFISAVNIGSSNPGIKGKDVYNTFFKKEVLK